MCLKYYMLFFCKMRLYVVSHINLNNISVPIRSTSTAV